MRRGLLLLLPFLGSTVLLGACGDGDGDADATSAATVAEGAAGEAASPPAEDGGGSGTRVEVGEALAERYCEVLTVTMTDAGLRAAVWGSQGLNDCPQEGFDAIDATVAAQQVGANLAVVNGPRYWVLDAIVANALSGSGETEVFGGVEMRSIAVVELDSPDRSPYTDTSVVRDTEFVFDAGSEVYELVAPDGSVYVMQSYSVEVDPGLIRAELATLGERLQLPEGWTFSGRVLDEELVVEDIDGIATVVQDELRNTYQLRQRG